MDEYLALGDAGAWVMWCPPDIAPEKKAGFLRESDSERGWWSRAGARRVFVDKPELFKWFVRVECDE